jgi:hypothetical protein
MDGRWGLQILSGLARFRLILHSPAMPAAPQRKQSPSTRPSLDEHDSYVVTHSELYNLVA